mgnify:FL=1|tara:strand:+ start:713 stop:1078 length:366 start_codon:yes stop_codon:yes gene_type:complete
MRELKQIVEKNDIGTKSIQGWVLNNIPKDQWQEIIEHGLESGMVSDLIYYNDTVDFHDKYENEIWDMLYEAKDDFSSEKDESVLRFISKLNGGQNVGSLTQMKNLLTWWAVEETVHRLINA